MFEKQLVNGYVCMHITKKINNVIWNFLCKAMILILMFFNQPLSSQNNISKRPMNAKGLTPDSVFNAVFDSHVPLQLKFEIANSITNFQDYDNLQKVFQTVLSEAKHQQVDSMQMKLYCRLILLNLTHQHFADAKVNVDSALLFEKNLKEPEHFFSLYHSVGLYYSFIKNEVESHKYLFKAIDYGEKIRGMEDKLASILYNISISYREQDDLLTFKNIVDHVIRLDQKANTPVSSIIANTLRVKYLLMRPEVDKKNNDNIKQNMLDSIYLYANKAIDVYNNTENKEFLESWNALIGSCYRALVDAEGCKTYPDWNKVLEWLDKSESISVLTPIHNLNNLLYRVQAYNYQKKHMLVVEKSLQALRIIEELEQDSIFGKPYYYLSHEFYSQIVRAYEYSGDYASAYKYVDECSKYIEKIDIGERYQAIKELEAKYDSEAKGREIMMLQEHSRSQKRIKYLLAGITMLFVILGYLTVVRKKTIRRKFQIIRKRTANANLPAVLNDSAETCDENERGEIRTEAFLDEPESDDKLNPDIFISEIKHLLDKYNYKDSAAYVDRLQLINDRFITQLKEASGNTVSAIYIKYCICFVIKMEVKEIAECLSVETSSVHMVRYRLKKKFNLNKHQELNVYLAGLLQKS